MKKIFLAALALALVAAACNQQTGYNQNNQNNNSNQNNNTGNQTQTYSNSTYGFSFEYPKTAQFITPSYANLQDKIVQIQLANTYPGTNFGDAAVSVSAQYAKDLAACLKLTPPQNGDGFKTKVSINGVDFYKTASSGAAAGNRYDSTIYRTVKETGGACIEISQTIHTSNIGNYEPGTVTEVDRTPIQQELDKIVNSFKFTS